MSNFTSKEDAVSFIKEIRLNNLHDWQFSQKLLEIENIIVDYYDTDDYAICSDCSYDGNNFNEDDMDERYEDGYETGTRETLESIMDYVERRLK